MFIICLESMPNNVVIQCNVNNVGLFFSVVFQFKSSKKSNNGTDVNAGQIPQLLYR